MSDGGRRSSVLPVDRKKKNRVRVRVRERERVVWSDGVIQRTMDG